MNLTIADEGDKVVIVFNGKRVCDMPADVAKQVSKLIYQKAMQVDEYVNANRIIMDQAIMQRAGLPFGLSSNPMIQDEARKEAQWNTDLRRAMPLVGVETKGIVGAPSIARRKGV